MAMLEKKTVFFPNVQSFLMRYYISITDALLKYTQPHEERQALKELYVLSLALWLFIRPRFVFEGYGKTDKRLKKLDGIFNTEKTTFNNISEAVASIKELLEGAGEKEIFLEFNYDIGDYENFKAGKQK